jgi:hypothetical protein
VIAPAIPIGIAVVEGVTAVLEGATIAAGAGVIWTGI